MATTPAPAMPASAPGKPAPPLVVPLASAVAGELRGIEPATLLYDVDRLSGVVKDLSLSLGVDAAVVEFGSWWEVEAAGVPLDWSGGAPRPRPAPFVPRGELDLGAGRAPVVLEALRRLRTTVGDRIGLAAGVTGPVTLASLSQGALAPAAAASLLVPVVRALAEAGASIVWIVETAPPPADVGGLGGGLAPLFGTARFFGALPVLHLAGEADGWAPLLAGGGPSVPCFDPEASPALAAQYAERGEFGLAVAPDASPGERARALAASGRCRILTNTRELAGQVRAADLPELTARLRTLAMEAS